MSGSSLSSDSSSSSSSSEVFDTSTIIPLNNRDQLVTPAQIDQSDSILQIGSSDPASSQLTHPPLSGLTNLNLLTQDTQATSISNTQPLLKSTPLTAPTRAWISQRVAKTIHIDQDKANNDDESQPMQIDPNQNYSTTSSSSHRIVELGILEQQLSQLLSLASDVLGSLTPPLNQEQSSTNEAIEQFSSSVNEYFELLNKIQLGLRTSMAHLRSERISTRILFEPIHVRVPNCPVGLGSLKLNDPSISRSLVNSSQEETDKDDTPSLSLGSLIAERNAWRDFVDSLQSIKAGNNKMMK